jgi:hypothetical protein
MIIEKISNISYRAYHQGETFVGSNHHNALTGLYKLLVIKRNGELKGRYKKNKNNICLTK